MGKVWTEIEIDILKKEYRKEKPDVKKVAEILNRTPRAIRNKAYQLKITKQVHLTENEIEYIKQNYKRTNLRQIAKDLGREKNYQNICRVARRLGLTNQKGPKVEHPTPADLKRKPKYKTEEERRIAISEFMKEWHKNNDHPRGMKGKTHSKEYRKKRSELTKKMWEDPDSYFNSEKHREKLSERMSKVMVKRIKENPKSVYSNARGGIREDLGFYVRSKWEANVARYLKFLEERGEIYKWEYEPDTFWFENIKRGTRSYTPDFKVWETENSEPVYWEVKGYMDQKSKTRLKRMEKYYPKVKIKLIMQKEYNEIGKLSSLIKHWEV